MLLKKRILGGIAEGRVSLAFRRWLRPTVKPGGSLRTAIGVLAIKSIDEIDEAKITDREAEKAGYVSREELLAELNARPEGSLYRIALSYAGEDPRLALRQQNKMSNDEIGELTKRLDRMDASSNQRPWTKTTLQLIAKHPGKRAPDLAANMGMETKPFKINVRKLKELGLTESLSVGYRLSPRGNALYEGLIKRRAEK